LDGLEKGKIEPTNQSNSQRSKNKKECSTLINFPLARLPEPASSLLAGEAAEPAVAQRRLSPLSGEAPANLPGAESLLRRARRRRRASLQPWAPPGLGPISRPRF